MQAIAFGDVADIENLKSLQLFYFILPFFGTIYGGGGREKLKIAMKLEYHPQPSLC